MNEPPPLPDNRDVPVPRRSRKSRYLKFLLCGLIAIYFPVSHGIKSLQTEILFVDDAKRSPENIKVTLRSPTTEKQITVKNGRLRFFKSDWDQVVISDESYIHSSHSTSTRVIHIERNELLKLRQAAIGGPSIPQRGDPDPSEDRK